MACAAPREPQIVRQGRQTLGGEASDDHFPRRAFGHQSGRVRRRPGRRRRSRGAACRRAGSASSRRGGRALEPGSRAHGTIAPNGEVAAHHADAELTGSQDRGRRIEHVIVGPRRFARAVVRGSRPRPRPASRRRRRSCRRRRAWARAFGIAEAADGPRQLQRRHRPRLVEWHQARRPVSFDAWPRSSAASGLQRDTDERTAAGDGGLNAPLATGRDRQVDRAASPRGWAARRRRRRPVRSGRRGHARWRPRAPGRRAGPVPRRRGEPDRAGWR